MGLFITFEGGEGSGKSTQAKALARRLISGGFPAVLSREPGGTRLGRQLRRILKRGDTVQPLTELLLFNAARVQLVSELIRPSLEQGKIVILDRYADSTVAYQGYGRGLELETVRTINTQATGGLQPDLVIFLDVDVEHGLARKRRLKPDRFEQEELAFHRRVRQGYLGLAAAEPQRWLVVDGALLRARIEAIIWGRVEGLLRERGYLK